MSTPSEGSTSTPHTPSSSAPLPPISPFLTPTGVRFPLYATIQGVNSPLLYSPTIFGQSVLPWRPIGTTPAAKSSAVTTSTPPTVTNISTTSHSPLTSTASVVQGYASFAQLPGLMYPLSSLNMPLVMTDGKKAGEASKRRSEATTEGEETKRLRLATGTPPTSNANSTPSPSQPPLHRPTPHRSPVIKYNILPYNIGQAAVVTGSPGQQALPTSLSQTVILSLAPQTSSRHILTSTSLTPSSLTATQSPNTPPTTTTTTSSTMSTPPTIPLLPVTPSLIPLPHLSLPPHTRITLLRCFGPIPANTIISHQLVECNLLLDLYRSSYFTTSSVSNTLSPESCALLTICYLNCLRRGERICVESLHTMLKYARTGEADWLQYYKRHKKMSESTFVQSQLTHLSRISVYPALGKVRVMISSQHLGEGILLTMQNLAQLVAMTPEAMPDYVVVLAVRPNIGVEFCVLVLEPLQSQLLLQMQDSSKRRGGGRGAGTTTSDPPLEIRIRRNLLVGLRTAQKRLNGAVHIPFQDENGYGSMTVSPSEAEGLTPSAPHVIEHRPKGPFQEQYSVAMHLLQKLSIGGLSKVEEFQDLDFCVLCPPEETCVSEMVREVVRSGLVQCVVCGEGEEGEREEVILHEVQRRVIRCNSDKDIAKFSRFLAEVEATPTKLFLVVCEHADLTCSLSVGVADHTHSSGVNMTDSLPHTCFGESKALLSQPNVVLLYVTSHPYRLETNRCLVPSSNVVHWPLQPVSQVGLSEGVEFCHVDVLCSQTAREQFRGMEVRETDSFEEEFHGLCVKLSPKANFLQIRHQLLLNDYVSALQTLTGHTHCHTHCHTHSDTLAVIHSLVSSPLNNSRGHGPMVLIRSHDSHLGRQFYQQLRATRDALGLQYRFEIIFDNGKSPLTLTPHFSHRITKGSYSLGDASGCHSNGCHGSLDHLTYSDLENVPCVVVMVGEERAHVELPSSLQWVDLRLIYPTVITRSAYEADIGWMNGHFAPSPTPSHPHLSHDSPAVEHPAVDEGSTSERDGTGHSDSEEVFTESHDVRPHPLPHPPHSQSSSSSRRSSYAENTHVEEGQKEGQRRGGGGGKGKARAVVEWHPKDSVGGEGEEGEGEGEGEGEEEEEGEGEGEEVIDVSELHQQTPLSPQPTTVVIDPPEDQMDSQDHGGTWSYAQNSILPNHWGNGMETTAESVDQEDGGGEVGRDVEEREEGEGEEGEVEEVDLFADLSDVESDAEEEGEGGAHTRTCLLPRPYHHIWTSRNAQQSLLLSPAQGVEWANVSKYSRGERTRRPPLFDPDPTHQSAYYRRWTKPSSSLVKKVLDALLRETSSGMKRRFLLAGPPRVGKTGAWQLLVRLLHDHLRSSHGVLVEDPPLQPPLILQVTPTEATPTSTPGCHGTHSRVVPHSFLQQLSQELQHCEDKKLFIPPAPSPPPHTPPSPNHHSHTSPPSPQHTTLLLLSPYAAHDHTHSCVSCAEHKRESPPPDLVLLTQSFPVDKEHHITVQWSVPPSQSKYCVTNSQHTVVERLCLPTVRTKGQGSNSYPLSPVFSTSVGRDSSALLDLSHTLSDHLHVVVTVQSELAAYVKAWPHHLIMALPDSEASGRGMLLSRLKSYLSHTYQQNMTAVKSEGGLSRTVWPWVAVMGDGCAMWRRVGKVDGWRSADVSLSLVLHSLEQEGESTQCAAVSIPQWSKQLDSAPLTPHSSPLTSHDLNHGFFLLNLPLTADVNYNCHCYTSPSQDFNLQLSSAGLKTLLRTDYSVVMKHFSSSAGRYPLHTDITALTPDVDSIVVSLHDSATALLHYPGPYLLEHYLRHKSSVLFPSARSPYHPVLMVDNYVSLGPETFVSFVKAPALESESFLSSEEASNIQFGGLVLYLCEGRVRREQLLRLSFVPGACLCLVTHNCRSLVGEVGRLDLEERWKFRLKDEYKTACPDSEDYKPLFFLLGHFGQ